MKKNIIYSLLLVVAVLFAGCEDRLDIAKHGNMGGQDDFYKTNQTVYFPCNVFYVLFRVLLLFQVP